MLSSIFSLCLGIHLIIIQNGLFVNIGNWYFKNGKSLALQILPNNLAIFLENSDFWPHLQSWHHLEILRIIAKKMIMQFTYRTGKNGKYD